MFKSNCTGNYTVFWSIISCVRGCMCFFLFIQHLLVKLAFVCIYLPRKEKELGKTPDYLSVNKKKKGLVFSSRSLLWKFNPVVNKKAGRDVVSFLLFPSSRRTGTGYLPFPAVFISNLSCGNGKYVRFQRTLLPLHRNVPFPSKLRELFLSKCFRACCRHLRLHLLMHF